MSVKEIDTKKLSKEVNDTLVHRNCVMRSGNYMADYLRRIGRSLDAIRLLGRCNVHDVSKLVNTEEFMSLASIVDDIGHMSDVTHVLSEKQREAIALHWKNNTHHPEHYENSNDMTDLDLLEMACDCHARSKQYGTDLMSYVVVQQDKRFHFDEAHYSRFYLYCSVLAELTKEDDYSCIFDNEIPLDFNLRDSTISTLENFDEVCYVDAMKTSRLYLEKIDNPDFASVVYSIRLCEDNTRVGQITLLCNGTIYYKIYVNYQGNGYAREAIRKLIEITLLNELTLEVKDDNQLGIVVANDLGFKQVEQNDNTLVFKLKKGNSV